jgi:hypothetical protein
LVPILLYIYRIVLGIQHKERKMMVIEYHDLEVEVGLLLGCYIECNKEG